MKIKRHSKNAKLNVESYHTAEKDKNKNCMGVKTSCCKLICHAASHPQDLSCLISVACLRCLFSRSKIAINFSNVCATNFVG